MNPDHFRNSVETIAAQAARIAELEGALREMVIVIEREPYWRTGTFRARCCNKMRAIMANVGVSE